MKLMKVLVAALVMAAMVTPAIAEDRLSLNGSLLVRGVFVDYDIESGKGYGLNNNGFSNAALGTDADTEGSQAWNTMRLRIGGKLAVAEGVSVHFRFDAAESSENWSDPAAWASENSNPWDTTSGTTGAYRYTNRRADIQFDTAYLQLEKNGYTFKAGQLYFGGFGLTRSFQDSTAAGFIVSKGPVTIAHAKTGEESLGGETLQVSALEGDASTTSIEYQFKGDGFSLTPIVAYTSDDTSNATNANNGDVLGLGLAFTTDLGPVALKGEIDYFDGENNAETIDQKGLQVYLDGSMAATDTVKVGAHFIWADAQDGVNERQFTNMTKDFRTDWAFVDFNPLTLGAGDFAYLDNFDVFDPSNNSAGSIAFGLTADVKASDDLALTFGASMFETEDDDVYDMEGYMLNAKAVYNLMANTKLAAQFNYTEVEDNETDADDEALGLITSLTVSF